MIVCVAVTDKGEVGERWARSERIALADIGPDGIRDWRELEVGWGELRESGPEGLHHARIARFLREHDVDLVAAHHVGPPMQNMLAKLGVALQLGVSGPAREAAVEAASGLTAG